MTTYTDTAKCPEGHSFRITRRAASAGYVVQTFCRSCDRPYRIQAGPLPTATADQVKARALLERDIEARLVQRVKQLGGEVRKVAWIGRNSAPDRVVMVPGPGEPGLEWKTAWARTIWVELKAPGKAATFPRNAHERAQQREHERMRRMGQRVEVVDSYEQIEEILK